MEGLSFVNIMDINALLLFKVKGHSDMFIHSNATTIIINHMRPVVRSHREWLPVGCVRLEVPS